MASEIDWKAHVAAWRASFETGPQYCERVGIKLSGLRYWAGRLKREAAEERNVAASGPGVRLARVRTRSAPGSEEPATREQGPAAVSESAGGSTVRVLAGPLIVELGPAVDARTLERVLGAVMRASSGAAR